MHPGALIYLPKRIVRVLETLNLKPQQFMRAVINSGIDGYPTLTRLLSKDSECSLSTMEAELSINEAEMARRKARQRAQMLLEKAEKKSNPLGTTPLSQFCPVDQPDEEKKEE